MSRDELHEHFDKDKLPTFLGGTLTAASDEQGEVYTAMLRERRDRWEAELTAAYGQCFEGLR